MNALDLPFGAVHEVRFKQIHRQRSIYDRQTCSEFFFKKKDTLLQTDSEAPRIS